ncbi:MAG: polyribonucleotide nucleotidyltransferase [Candidatus Nomurabacteria bacterium]|nr:MAG: polyribonucleotide nucleotidyltransferase [Candidatus Nomurabacteria bacterium]
MIKLETEFCGRKLSLEINRLAFQSKGAVTVTYGDTVVLGIANVKDEVAEGFDYFPLSVDYEERMYAAGKISGSKYLKREGRPTDEAILTGRLIDRPIRPLFPKGFRNETQVVVTVLSLDPELGAETPALIAASAALMLTGAPFEGPVAGVRYGLDQNGNFIQYPTKSQSKESFLDLFVAGTENAIMMVEAGAKEVSEEHMTEALIAAQEAIQPAIQIQKDLAAKLNIQPMEYQLVLPPEEVTQQVNDYLSDKLGQNVISKNNEDRIAATADLRKNFIAWMDEQEIEHPDRTNYWDAYDSAIKKDIRKSILDNGARPDGRTSTEIRPITAEVGILPRTHGSAVFTRGETQALNITTLAPLSYSQTIDGMTGEREDRFFHHYNMPGYASGEIKRMGGTNRRETGHGHLAQRANEAVLPTEQEFPYAIRVVTEITSSNGSTSMAATCSTCLSLMDAGVPIKAPVSGIAMGLMMDEPTGKYVILSDIMGPEDFSGDMDFKVAGTPKGITALQMDIKLKGLTPQILSEALQQAKAGRLHILQKMLEVIPTPKKDLSPYAPRVVSIQINPEKIGAVIGKGGENIQALTKETETEIDINDEGIVTIASPNLENIELAKKRIEQLTEEPEIGKTYNGKVVKIMEFGAFVNILPGIDGLVHISNLSLDGSRVEKVEDVVKEDQEVTVKIIDIDQKSHKISLKLIG